MKTLPDYRPPLVIVDSDVPAALSDAKQRKRDALVIVARYLRELRAKLNGGASLGPAVAEFERQHAAGELPPDVTTSLRILRPNKADQCPDRATLYRWDDKYRQHLNGDTAAAAPRHQGRKRQAQGWEALALRLWNTPTKRSKSSVAAELREVHGFTAATDSAVRRYLDALPANLGEHSSQRLGARLYRNTQRGFVRRNTEALPSGFIYQGDGHAVDVYIAHPLTGDIWRPELTAWMDVRSRYIAGWYISEAESSHSTLFALSRALMAHDHVPAMLHIDNGSGYASKMMGDESVGFYARFSIQPMFALPYNAKAKGQLERWFGTMERDFGKRWETYCGADMAPEILQRIVREVKSGTRMLPTLRDYMTALAEWIDHYHHRPHDGLNGRTPAEVWAELERAPVHTPDAAIVRPRLTRKVGRQSLRLHNREYAAPELVAYNGQLLLIEYDLFNDEQVRCLLQDGRWICDARLVHKADYIPASRIEEARQKRLDGQLQRLQNKRDELEARAGHAITHSDRLADIEALNAGAELALEDKSGEVLVNMGMDVHASIPVGEAGGDEPLDILSLDY